MGRGVDAPQCEGAGVRALEPCHDALSVPRACGGVVCGGDDALMQQGRLDERGGACAGAAVRRFPNRPGWLHAPGRGVRCCRGAWAEAVERCAAMRSAFPEHASGWVRGAEALLQQGRLDEAAELAGEAVRRLSAIGPAATCPVARWRCVAGRGRHAVERWAAMRTEFPEDMRRGGCAVPRRCCNRVDWTRRRGWPVRRWYVSPTSPGGAHSWAESAMSHTRFVARGWSSVGRAMQLRVSRACVGIHTRC